MAERVVKTMEGMPRAFAEGPHDLRPLGNDAAPIGSRYYEEIGPRGGRGRNRRHEESIRTVYKHDATMKALAGFGTVARADPAH